MGNEFNLSTVHFGCCFAWEDVQKRLGHEFGYRLPTIAEAIMIEFGGDAIWVSDMINDKHLVMDNQWGAQIVRGGKYGMVLVEVEDDINN